MMRANPEIDALLAELLDSGVSPKYVSRIAAELEDHYADLEEEAQRLGVPRCEAARDARLRLGNCSVIAREFALRPELRSWVYSRWLERVLRLLGSAYLLVRAPARAVAAGQPIVLRYTAATAAGSSVTFAILLLLTSMMSPESNWGARLVEHAGAALGAWELQRPPRNRPAREPRPTVPASGNAEPAAATDAEERGAVDGARAAANREAAATNERNRKLAPALQARRGRDDEPERFRVFQRSALARHARLFHPAAPPQEVPIAASAFFDSSKARVTLADIEPMHLGIEVSEFRPIVKAAPEYPIVAARRGVEGHVVVEYTVTRDGTVEDPVVVDSSNPIFNRAALDATRHFRYRPRLIRGEAVDVHGVRLLIRFELEA